MSADVQLLCLSIGALAAAVYVMFVAQMGIARIVEPMSVLQGKAFAGLATLISIPLTAGLLPFAVFLFANVSVRPGLIFFVLMMVLIALPAPFAFLLARRISERGRGNLRTIAIFAALLLGAIIVYRYIALR